VGAMASWSEGGPVEIPISEVTFGDNLRGMGLDEAHVALLMEASGQWPPVLVWGTANLLVDGHHRVEAARRLGHGHVLASRFTGSAEDAYLESLRRNISHGLPLTLEDRRRAARRVLGRHPHWSDRRIAALCGLSGKTVARLRREVHQVAAAGAGAGVVVDMDRRVGRDGRRRPVHMADLAERVERALRENPGASLRAVAAAAGGVSPETVRRARARVMARGADHAAAGAGLAAERPLRAMRDWADDRALAASDDMAEFARWLSSTDVDDDHWRPYVWTIPVGRIYEIVDEARRRARCWASFASLLECRVRT